MGLGKSIEGLCRIALGNHYPTVIVTTASTMDEFVTNCLKWLPSVPTYVVQQVHMPIPAPGWRGVLLTTWDMLRHHATALTALRPRLLIADEAQYASVDPEAQRSQALLQLADVVPHILLMTGTPVKNDAIELWRLLCILDSARWSRREAAFKTMNKEDVLGNPNTGLTRAIRQYMLRRTKENATPDLPSKRYETIAIDLPPDVMKEYKRIERQFETWLRKRVNTLAIKEARKMGEEVDEDELEKRIQRTLKAKMLARMGYLRRFVGKAKVPAAVDWIIGMARMREPCVVFVEHQDVLLGIRQRVDLARIPYVVIDGSTSAKARKAAKKAFQAGRVGVLIASHAAKEGITLTAARFLLQVERWFTAASEEQAADRIHRLTQLRNVVICRLHARGTVDERMNEIVNIKQGIHDRVVEAGVEPPPPRVKKPPARP